MAPSPAAGSFSRGIGGSGLSKRTDHRLLLVICGLLIVAMSWLVLYVQIWVPGLETSVKDPRHYLASAVQLVSTGHLELLELDLGSSVLVSHPLSSFPPLTSLVLAGLIACGASIERAPTLLSLAIWPLLMGAIGLLTHRLCRDPTFTLLAVGLAAVTWPFMHPYTRVSSEILFLPMVVLATATFTGLPTKEGRITPQLAAGSLLTTLVLLTRYAGVFFYAALLIWWFWQRSLQKRFRPLLWEMSILAVPGLVFLGWVGRNFVLTGHLFGPVLMSETLDLGPRHVVKTILAQSTWLVLPAVRPEAIWRSFGLPGAIVVVVGASVGVSLFLLALRGRTCRLPTSPIVPFLGLYVGFLVVAPAFMRMQGLRERYIAVALALVQPYLVTRLAGVPRRWSQGLLLGFLVVNLGLAVLSSASERGFGSWIKWRSDRDGEVQGVAGTQLQGVVEVLSPSWVRPTARLHDLERHLPGLAQVVETLDAKTAIVSNAPDLFSWRPLLPLRNAVELWLPKAECHPPSSVAVVIVERDLWQLERAQPPGRLSPPRLRALLEETCPEALRIEAPGGTVYLLPARASSSTVGQRRATRHEGAS